ncbi:MAG: hypothetical protein WCI17_11715, partial [bacterium]
METESTGSGVVDILLKRGAITREKLDTVSSQESGPIEKRLMNSQLVSQDDMTLAVAEYVRMPPIKLAHFIADPSLLELQPKENWDRSHTFPVWKSGKTLLVALADPFDIHLIENLRMATSLTIVPLVAAEKEINDLLGRATSANAAAGGQNLDLEDVMKTGEGEIEVDSSKEGHEESLEKTLETAEGAPVI